MEFTSYQNLIIKFWKKNYYTLAQMRSITDEVPANKRRFNYAQFEYLVGITVEEYDNNVELYKNMKYEDIKEYLSNKNSNIETI